MFNLAENTKLRGLGYRILNALRPCNIIALLLVAIASWVMIVMTGMTGQFFFFDAIAHVFVSTIALFLLLTEVPLGPLRKYFARVWPVFSDAHGLFWLGAAMVVLGCDMLANLNKPAFSIKSLGLPLWRLILAAGILAITFGAANLVATVVFRDGPARLTARMIRTDGNLADGGKLGASIAYDDDPLKTGNLNYYYPSSVGGGGSSTTSSTAARLGSKTEQAAVPGDVPAALITPQAAVAAASARFKRMTQVFKKGTGGVNLGGKKIQISKPIPMAGVNYNGRGPAKTADDADDADSYDAAAGDSYTHTNDANVDIERADAATDYDGRSAHSHSHSQTRTNDNGFFDDRASPILPSIRRPPTALHPAMSSHYSVADMDRF